MDCLLLHGWGTSNKIWQGFEEQLSAFNKITAPCLYEIADDTKDKNLDSIAGRIEERIKTDSIIIAWSLGGLVATYLAGMSNKIKAIIYIASPPCFINKHEWNNVIEEKAIKALQNNLEKNTESALNYFAGLIAHGDMSAKETNKFIRNNTTDKKHKETLFALLNEMRLIDLRKEFSKVKIPVKIILGENDSLINFKIKNDIKKINPNVQCSVINNCGHAPFISKQHETIKIIDEFINEQFK
ncbi:MAG TPA: alpha/beta fold hydrolase [Thiotrichaceae bacterium]|jgi:pimeloyl-[acyl-carrier protein] methyl ester esterase|nr:alpha/beta fold hydrolase [Thiotrichaceae bacterium]